METFATMVFIMLPALAYNSAMGAHTYTFTIPPGQSSWDFNLLDNHHQSPTDLVLEGMEPIQPGKFNPLLIRATRDPSIKYIVRNSGHGVEVVADPEELKTRPDYVRPSISGGILLDEYVFQNVHYHWGEHDEDGSEHRLNHKSFSLEGHLVMFKKAYGNLKTAVGQKDGIVVFTFFFFFFEHNQDLDLFLQYLPQVQQYGSGNIPLQGSDAFLWFLPQVASLNKDYLAYPGSLTTPEFQESVTFVICPVPVPISHEQLEQFRQLVSNHHSQILSNKRALQPFQHRPIAICRDNFRVEYGTIFGDDYEHQGADADLIDQDFSYAGALF